MAGSDEDFLSRWSRRKREVRAGVPVEEPRSVVPAVPVGTADAAATSEKAAPPEPLPPVESLTPESDFTRFMDREVDPGVRRDALKKLFSDPRYNVMDGLDIYIDDYSIPDPIPDEWLGKLSAMAGLGDVPGRLKAEREAREKAEREASADPDTEPGAGEGAGAAPAETEASQSGEGAAGVQDEAPSDPGGGAAPRITP